MFVSYTGLDVFPLKLLELIIFPLHFVELKFVPVDLHRAPFKSFCLHFIQCIPVDHDQNDCVISRSMYSR